MPVSKNRKTQKHKSKVRNQQIKEQRNHIDRIFKEAYDKIKDKSLSIVDMLNKEETYTGVEQTEDKPNIEVQQ